MEVYSGMNGSPNNFNHSIVAFIIDGEVVSILNTDERMSSILLSNPEIIDISDHIKSGNNITEGYRFNGSQFYIPEFEVD